MQTNTRTIERVFDLTDSKSNRIFNMSLEQARERVASGSAEAIAGIDGSFALVARRGETVLMARSMDRPLRYFLAKRQDGPALVAADRIDSIAARLAAEGIADQFHPSYTRMVPAYHLTQIQLVGCPDPSPTHERFFTPERNALPADPPEIGRRYISALADELAKWLQSIPEKEPVGVAFSGGIDSGAVFLATYAVMRKLGMNPARLKAFTLSLGGGEDLEQARGFLRQLDLEMFLEQIEVDPGSLDPKRTIRVIEDYKPLDVESASMALALAEGIRKRYPDWKYLADGDGGDENLKDYPIEDDPELTIRSVLNNPLLYQEGWGVGKLKHSLTYSGGQSRSYTRTYAPLRALGFDGFSPFLSPRVVEVAEGVPFIELTDWNVDRLYALKGAIVASGIEALTGLRMPIHPKRRFQHGAIPAGQLRARFGAREADYRSEFHSRYA